MFCTKRRAFLTNLPLIITAILITVTGIIFHQSVLRIIPLYFSLIVASLQARASRVAYLIGAFNSILYACVYFGLSIYASAISALAFSFPLQLITYIRWRRNPSGEEKTTVFRAMSARARIVGVLVCALIWTAGWLVLSRFESSYRFFDLSGSLIGMITSILAMLAYIEYAPLMVLSASINLCLYINMLPEVPGQTTYLCYAAFSLICQIRCVVTVFSLYKKQTSGSGEEKNENERKITE